MVQAGEREERGARNTAYALLDFRINRIGVTGIEATRHGHRRQHVLQRRTVLLRRRESSKVVAEHLLAYRCRDGRGIDVEPAVERRDKCLRIRAIEAAAGW